MDHENPYQPGDQVRIKQTDDLGALAGRNVTILSGPDEHGMYRVEVVVHGYVSADHIRP